MATLSPPPKLQFFDANGVPLVGGKLYSYAAGTTTPLATYTSAAETAFNTNPIILNSRGEAEVWLGSPAYKFKLTTATDVEIWTVDDITSLSQASLAAAIAASETSLKAYYAASDGSSKVGFIQAGVGAVARTAQAKMRDFINVRDFGAVGNGGADDTAAIQAAVNASNGNTIFFPTGQYRITAPITATQSISIQGIGNGAGPGAAEQSNTQVTQFFLDYANPSCFVVTNTTKPCLFRDFQINVNPPWRVAGAGRGISISAPSGTPTNANTKIENVAFNWLHTAIYAYKPAWWTIQGCYFGNWTQDAIFSETQPGTEASLGWVRRNFFFGDPAVAQRSCIYLRNGYTIISENEILGTQYGIQVDVAGHPAGFIKIINNTIEEQFYAGVYLSGTDTNDVTMVDISGNEFSSVLTSPSYLASIWIGDGPARQWLQDMTIKNNITRNLGTCNLGHIRVGAGANVMVSDNVLENIGASPVANGIVINGTGSNAALAAQIAVLDNMFQGSFTARYLLNGLSGTGTILRDTVAMTVAQVPSNAANGSEIYASDGRSTSPGNYTLIAGGAGAKAFRQRGAWLTPGDLP